MARSHLLTPTIFSGKCCRRIRRPARGWGWPLGLGHQFDQMLHSGGTLTVEPRVWIDRLTAALDRRHGLVDDSLTTAWRWVHGENDDLPGLVLDRYDDTLVIKLYSAAWYPHLGDIIAAAQEVLPSERVVLRCARRVSPPAGAPGDGDVLVGSRFDGTLTYLERGLTMSADVRRGNKTGAFLDQRDNRTLVGAACDSARVLDVFTATGGFALAAAAGGARSVHLVDISQPAIDVAKANIEQNRNIAAVRRCEITSQRGDAFDVMESLAASGSNLTSSLSTHRRLLRTRNLFRRHCRHIAASHEPGCGSPLTVVCSFRPRVQAESRLTTLARNEDCV